MKLGTRLLLPLLAAVTLVMGAYGAWAVQQRERALRSEAERETQAYATALALALDESVAAGDLAGVERIIERVAREPKIYGVIVYDSAGTAIAAASPLELADAVSGERLEAVLRDGSTIGAAGVLRGAEVYTVLRPIRGAEREVVGVLQAAEPLAFVEAEIVRTRQRVGWTTLALLAAITLLLLWLVRRSVTRPLEQTITAARALGRGDLRHRVEVSPGAGEVTALASEFNRMAAHLETARSALIAEAEERVALERRLRETEKLAAVGNLAAGLAHEIAAPLNVVRGRAELLLKRDVEADSRERHLRIIVGQIARITTVVRNLLDFARRREPRFQELEPGAVVAGVVELLEHELTRAEIALEVTAHDSEPALRGDPDLLHQLLLNLMLNAMQALEHATGERRIRVAIDAVREPPALEVTASPEQGWIRISVEDSGPGIPEELRERLFEPFYTTKPAGAGTGLGLAVAAGIAREHGGGIEAASSPSGGAAFRVYLPAVAEPEPAHG